MFKSVLLVFTLSVVMVSCSKKAEVITVASEQADCVGVAPQKCLLIKTSDNNDWEYLYSGIEGFNYEPGFEYVIEIRREKVENPAADQSSEKLIFVREVTKDKKVSDNLPDKRV